MNDVEAIVGELADLAEGPPIVTLYLDTQWNDEHQRERVRLAWRERVREARRLFGDDTEEGRGLTRTFDRLDAYVDGIVNQDLHLDANGIVVVASEPRGLFVDLPLPLRLGMAMFVDRRPRLFPLMEALAGLRSALVAEVDSSGAQILEWRVGAVVDERDLEREVPNRHKQGGWRQKHVQAHIKWHIQLVWQECAALLQRLAQEQPEASLLLFGQESNLRNFAKLLPSAISNRIIGMEAAPPDRPALLEQTRRLLEEERLREDFARVDNIVNAALSERGGAVGLEPVLAASNERRIHTLALAHGFDVDGFLCGQCGALWHAGGQGCVFCGGATALVPLREELVRRCIREGCEVRVVPDGGPLQRFRGLGALLRHLGQPRQPLGNLSPEAPSNSPS